MLKRSIALSCGALALALVASSCGALKDPEPWTTTVTYTGAIGRLVADPNDIPGGVADAAFGLIQVVNQTNDVHGFAIDDLGVYETIPKGKTALVSVPELRNHRTYTYYCQLHKGEINGSIHVEFVAEGER